MLEDDIRELEERLLKPAIRASALELDRLISDAFLEFGRSGRVYTKTQIIAALNAEPSLPATASLADFRLLVLAPNVVLATYRSGQSLRSSIWRREDDAWRVVFHQGTPTSA